MVLSITRMSPLRVSTRAVFIRNICVLLNLFGLFTKYAIKENIDF